MKLLKQSKMTIVILCACMLLWNSAIAAADNSTKNVFMTATQLADKIRTGELTSVQVVEAFFEQIDAHNPALNAIVTLNREGALNRANEADAALAAITLWGPLHGVPVTIKDIYATVGLNTTSGYEPLANYVTDFDATSVERLKNAGAIILGKTNVPVPMNAPAERSINALRIAWTDDFEGVPVTAETESALQSMMSKLKTAGCLVEKTRPDDFDIESAWLTWGEIIGMQTGVNMAPALRSYIYLRTKKSFADIPMQMRMYEPMTVKKYMEAMQARDTLIASLEEFLGDWDVWVCPVSSTPAFKHMEPAFYSGPSPVCIDQMHVDAQQLNYTIANFLYTVPFNVTGSPVVVIPIWYTKEGLPIGAQIIGRRWKDMELLQSAKLINDAAGAFKNPPGY